MTQTIPLARIILQICETYNGNKRGHMKLEHPAKMPLGATRLRHHALENHAMRYSVDDPSQLIHKRRK